jgi:spore coat polysaccharide biosynthesis predicted glycosyltransferase SpsG
MQIVTRGSVREGLGHLLRTRTFARQAQSAHEVEVIAIIEPELENVLAGLECPVRFVRNDAEVLPWLQAGAPDALVFDTTRFEAARMEEAAAAGFLLCSISPVFEHLARMDVIFTRTRRNEPLGDTRIFGGLHYAIFNDHCRTIDDVQYERNLASAELPIAVCMGGSDAANKTLRIVQALARLDVPTTIWVLLGEGYAHSYNTLVDAVRGDLRHEVILAKTSRSMWHILGNCALGLMAGGLTTIEAVHAGLPTLNLFDRPDHAGMLDELFTAGVCLDGGLMSNPSLDPAIETIRRLASQRDELRAMRARTRGLVDRQGATRVLRELEQQVLQKALRHRNTPSQTPSQTQPKMQSRPGAEVAHA